MVEGDCGAETDGDEQDGDDGCGEDGVEGDIAAGVDLRKGIF